MVSTALFQVYFFVSLMAPSSCMAGTNEPDGQGQGGVGYLASQLILKYLSDLETDVRELKAGVEMKAGVADMQELKAEISDLKSKYKDHPKTVFAQMQLVGVKSYKPGDRINFNSAVSNVGNAYDIDHGYFEAPCDGTYLFSVTLCTGQNAWVVFRTVQDGNIIGEEFTGDSLWRACSRSTAVTQMKSGARVWVEIDRVKGGQIESRYGIPSFTGVFLNNYQNP